MSHLEGEKLLIPNRQDQTDATGIEPGGSLAVAIAKYEQGDPSALGDMVFAFHSCLVARAGAKLRNAPNLQSLTDGEGAVASAMGSYWRAVGRGKYRGMKHVKELLGLLATIVDRKVSRQIRTHTRVKAGSGKVRNEPESGLEPAGREPAPPDTLIEKEARASAEAVLEQWRNHMKEKGLLEVAELVVEGQSYCEVARILGIGENKARRMITLVNALTRAFALKESPEP